jgi:hypothetical protein
MSNRHGNSGSPAGVLAAKPDGNTSAYLSTGGQIVLTSVQGDGTTASLFHDGTYSMNLTIQRSGDDLYISATLMGLNGFSQSLSATDLNATDFTFDRLGFLLGANLGADLASFSNLAISFMSDDLPGDFNLDEIVDAADYVAWRKTDNTPIKLDEWRKSFGSIAGEGGGDDWAANVPEPGSAVVAFATALSLLPYMRRQQW